jgi:heptosyltransferase-1
MRDSLPETLIDWVVEERWAELLCTLPTPRSGSRSPQRPLVDRVLTVNTRRWRHSMFSVQTWEQIAAGISEMRAGHYRAAVDFQGAARSALIAHWSKASVVYGTAQPRENVASMFYTREIIASGAHVVEQNLSLAEAVVGRSLTAPQVEFPHDEAAEKKCVDIVAGREFALLNPGAGWGAKQWPAERYGTVARTLAADGLLSLINFGPGEEELACATEAASGGAAQPIASSITELIAFTRRARLFVGGDTGPMHLAAALKVPVVAIFGPTNPARNGPFGIGSIVLRSASSPTTHSRRSQPDEGLLQITPDQVVSAARELLRSARA